MADERTGGRYVRDTTGGLTRAADQGAKVPPKKAIKPKADPKAAEAPNEGGLNDGRKT
jgi:hypothetical protein